jgi:hypothetical protein
MISGPQGKALADSLNITQEQLRARFLADPQGVGGMIQNFAAPTEATKNYNQARAQMKAQGMTDEQINAVMPPEMLALGGGSALPIIASSCSPARAPFRAVSHCRRNCRIIRLIRRARRPRPS